MAPTDQDSITVVVALQVCSNCLRILIRKSKIELHVDGFRKWFDGEARPVAWYGPIVMNTNQELQEAYQELREGTFLG